MHTHLDISFARFNDLTNDELYRIMQLRQEVFIVEQDCPYLDADGHDHLSFHLLGKIDGEIMAYLRVVPPGLRYEDPSIGRVITAIDVREKGYGKKILKEAIQFIAKKYPKKQISISAQHRLKEYYHQFGFVEEGEIYLEDDIDHIKMKLLPEPSKTYFAKHNLLRLDKFFAFGGLFLGSILVLFSFIEELDFASIDWVAKIEDKTISRERFELYLDSIDESRSSGLLDADPEKILSRMIDEELLIRRAIDLGMLDNNPQVRSVLIQKMIESILSEINTLEVSNQELESFYRSNQEFFLANPKISLETLKFSNYELAQQSKQFLLEGKNDQALKLADNSAIRVPKGLLPATKVREYIGPTLTANALAMTPGTISNPIPISKSYHLIILFDKSFDTPKPFESIVEQVKTEFLKQKRDALLQEYLVNLRKWYDVTKSTDL